MPMYSNLKTLFVVYQYIMISRMSIIKHSIDTMIAVHEFYNNKILATARLNRQSHVKNALQIQCS